MFSVLISKALSWPPFSGPATSTGDMCHAPLILYLGERQCGALSLHLLILFVFLGVFIYFERENAHAS